MIASKDQRDNIGIEVARRSREDWNYFIEKIGGVYLDKDQKRIISAVQHEQRVSVRSGTSRGKDYVAAWAAFCFFALTPKFGYSEFGEMMLTESTKVVMTAPTGRQVGDIMYPEITKLYNQITSRFPNMFKPHGMRLVGYDIRTRFDEWFLTGFKTDDKKIESWTGYHAPNIMFVVTEASGINEMIFESIDGNLQGNSRLLLVFNPNITTGYAARSTKKANWHSIKLNSLFSENVQAKKILIPGQVDYVWVKDKLDNHCTKILPEQKTIAKNDFEFEGQWYRPNDWFRIKVLGEFPEADASTLIPEQWIEAANENWHKFVKAQNIPKRPMRVACDVAGMGNDDTVIMPRFDNFVSEIIQYNAGGKANHMETAGRLFSIMKAEKGGSGIIDTVGEGAGVYSRCVENNLDVYSYKSGLAVKGLTDVTQTYQFTSLRDYSYWAVRDWLNPDNNMNPCLPENAFLKEELTETKWSFDSMGRPKIEPKDKIKERLGRSPDTSDCLAISFYPEDWITPINNLHRIASQL